ncbi:MAG: cupredoxin domain-containing protein [Alphaproteobacteria bacterium]
MKKILITTAAVLMASQSAMAETPEYSLTLKDHKFDPETIEIPADTKVKLIVKNEDETPAEFESDDFKREKIIKGGKEATIYVGPLPAGEYKFFDEFNMDTAQGVLIVK